MSEPNSRPNSDEESDAAPANEKPGRAKGKARSYGCGALVLLGGAALLGGGIHRMNDWATMSGGGKGGAIVMIVLGTLVILPFVVGIAIYVVAKIFLAKLHKSAKTALKDFENLPQKLAAAGESIVANNKSMYESVHTFRPATDADFESLDRDAYERGRREFSSLGYRELGDVVDETMEKKAGLRVPIRIMASTDGSSIVGFYNFPTRSAPRGFAGKVLFVYDLETEFTDGTFLTTANNQGLDLTTAATGIDRRQHPPETTPAELDRLHQSARQALLAAKAGAVACVIVNTLDDALELQKRQMAAKCAFRKQIGYVDPEEVRRIARTSSPDDPSLADALADVADTARKNERADPSQN